MRTRQHLLTTTFWIPFDIEIDAAEMTPENFNSAAAMWKMIERLQEN